MDNVRRRQKRRGQDRGQEEEEEDLLEEMSRWTEQNASVPLKNIKKSGKKESGTGCASASAHSGPGVLQKCVTERSVLEPVRAPQLRDDCAAAVALSFPKVFEAEESDPSASSRKKTSRSLFAQKMAQKAGPTAKTTTITTTAAKMKAPDWGQGSRLLEGTGLKHPSEVAAIHAENVAKLNSLSPTELEQMRSQIVSSLSPELLQFVTMKMRRKGRISGDDDYDLSSAPDGPPEVSCPPAPTILPQVKKIESDKMEWMGELESVGHGATTTTTRFSARFDFEGRLLPFDSDDITVKAGLHHHGQEPSRPGYTVGELLLLMRSTNSPQKILAMTTIGNLIAQHKRGSYDDLLEQNVLSELVDCGLITVLRLALDDRVESIRDASLACLRQVLVNSQDETVLDYLEFSCLDGPIQPSLPSELLKDHERHREFMEEQADLKDVEVVKLDVILGLLRMDLIPRLVYILKTLDPSMVCKKNILIILIRISRHSLQAAQRLINDSHLTDLVFAFWKESDLSVHAIKLFRIWIAWSKSSSKTLLINYDVRKVLPKFLILDSGAKSVVLEAFRLWYTCLHYGLLTNLVTDLFPIIMKYLLSLRHQIGSPFPKNDDEEKEEESPDFFCDVDIAVALLKIIESYGIHSRLSEANDVYAILVDSAMNGVQTLINMNKDRNDEEWRRRLRLLQAVFSALKHIFEVVLKGHGDVVECVERLSMVADEIVLPFLVSNVSREKLLARCQFHSAILSKNLVDGKKRGLKNLPSVGALCWRGDIVPVIAELSPFPFLRTATDLLNLALHSKAGLQSRVQNFLSCSEMTDYIMKVTEPSVGQSLVSNWFVSEENNFLWNITLFNTTSKTWGNSCTWKLSQLLLGRLNPKNPNVVHHGIELLTLSIEVAMSIEASFQNLNISHTEATTAVGDGKDILSVYKDFFPPQTNTDNSKLESLTCRHSGEVLLPKDWIYLPLVHKYKTEEEQATKISICLSWISMVLSQEVSSMCSPAAATSLHFSRLLSVFTSSSSLFLDPRVRSGLLRCVHQLFGKEENNNRPGGKLAMNLFADPIPGIDSNRDFFMEIMDQFQSVSYGDDCFSLCVILATRQNESFTRILWTDFSESLRSITLNAASFSLKKKEQHLLLHQQMTFDSPSIDVVRAFMTNILSGKVTKQRNPLLHDIAVSNLQQAWRNSDVDIVKSEIDKMLKELVAHGVVLK